jgi:hypothetical protein
MTSLQMKRILTSSSVIPARTMHCKCVVRNAGTQKEKQKILKCKNQMIRQFCFFVIVRSVSDETMK